VDGEWGFIPSDKGEAARQLVKGGYVSTLSIGYEPIQTRVPSQDEQKAGIWRYIKELRWVETSLVLFPMNPAARIDLATVKSLLAPGRELTPEEKEELTELDRQIQVYLGKAAGTPAPEAILDLAPDHPRRLAAEAKVRELTIRRLGISLPG